MQPVNRRRLIVDPIRRLPSGIWICRIQFDNDVLDFADYIRRKIEGFGQVDKRDHEALEWIVSNRSLETDEILDYINQFIADGDVEDKRWFERITVNTYDAEPSLFAGLPVEEQVLYLIANEIHSV